MTAHRQVRRVDLQREAGRHDRLVLVAHRGAERGEVLVGRGVVLVGQEQCDYPGRRRVHERARHGVAPSTAASERARSRRERLPVLVGDRAATDGRLYLGPAPAWASRSRNRG